MLIIVSVLVHGINHFNNQHSYMNHNPNKNITNIKTPVSKRVDEMLKSQINNVKLKDVYSLRLSDKGITDSELSEICEYFPRLIESLHLQYNFITEIKNDTFSKLPNLRVLHLSGNPISKIHPDAFIKNTKLQYIYIIAHIGDTDSLVHQLHKLKLNQKVTVFLIDEIFDIENENEHV